MLYLHPIQSSTTDMHSQPPSFAWFCYGVANTSFVSTATSLHTNCDAQENGEKKDELEFGVHRE